MEKQKQKAPELSGLTAWLNTHPLTLQDLQGKVVGLEFWTHGCNNCLQALPHLQALAQKYQAAGFVLISVHTPEFAQEKDLAALKKFIIKNHLTFPIAVDNEATLWQAYNNRYWPTLYLIDKQGRVSSQHVGEGGYHRIEHDIIHLLKD